MYMHMHDFALALLVGFSVLYIDARIRACVMPTTQCEKKPKNFWLGFRSTTSRASI